LLPLPVQLLHSQLRYLTLPSVTNIILVPELWHGCAIRLFLTLAHHAPPDLLLGAGLFVWVPGCHAFEKRVILLLRIKPLLLGHAACSVITTGTKFSDISYSCHMKSNVDLSQVNTCTLSERSPGRECFKIQDILVYLFQNSRVTVKTQLYKVRPKSF
jgi:hypothetical protein